MLLLILLSGRVDWLLLLMVDYGRVLNGVLLLLLVVLLVLLWVILVIVNLLLLKMLLILMLNRVLLVNI